MAATLGNGNITFGDSTVMYSANITWGQVTGKPFNDFQGGNWNCTTAPEAAGGTGTNTNCQYSFGTILTRSGDIFSVTLTANYAGYNNCNCNCPDDPGG